MLDRLTENELSDVALVAEKSASGAFQLYKFVKTLKGEIDRKDMQQKLKTMNKNGMQEFIFRGNIYDLSYFWNNKTLPLTDISALEKPVREAVKKNFNELANSGYITLTADKTALECTEKGVELYCDKNFISKTCEDRIDISNDIKKVVQQTLKKREIAPGGEVPNVPHINFNDNMVANANEIAHEAAKAAGNKTVQTAASTTAQAVTAGAATAAQVAYELAAGGIKIIKDKVLK